jgi:hypothetical protein
MNKKTIRDPIVRTELGYATWVADPSRYEVLMIVLLYTFNQFIDHVAF